MKRCIARYSEAFDVLLREVDKMRTRIEALENRDFDYDSNNNRLSNSDFNNVTCKKAYMKIMRKI